MKWMEPFLEDGQLAGKIVCPNKKCGAKLGNYDWAGVCCSCKEWVTPVRLSVLCPLTLSYRLISFIFFCSAFVDDRDSASTARKSTRLCEATSSYVYVTPPLALGPSESHPTSLVFDTCWFFYIELASLQLLLLFFQIVLINLQCPVSNANSHPILSFTVVAQIRSDVVQKCTYYYTCTASERT